MRQVVYVLTNPAMPGLVKLGCTCTDDANPRISQLYTTGVPVPFKLEFACKVDNSLEVERALHSAFGPYRLNPKREFFKIEPEQAIAILKLLHSEETTTQAAPEADEGVDKESLAAREQLRSKRPNLNFEEMGIPIGSTLLCIHPGAHGASVTVTGPKKVQLADEEVSLTAATKHLLGLEYGIQPSPHWTFGGRLLREMYDETYGVPD